mgnify:CR=1 FL=1
MLIKRILYYLVGVAISSVGVYFFWQKKKATFDYGMDARTLKTIRIRTRLFTNTAINSMQKFGVDSLKISTILNNGDVDFGRGNPRKKPCAEYSIHGKHKQQKVKLWIIRCDTLATIDLITTYK